MRVQDGKSIDVKAVQFLKAPVYRDVHKGILTDVKEVQFSKMQASLVVTFGKSIDVNPVQSLKAFAPRCSHSGIFIDFKLMQPENPYTLVANGK
jgi:hypothetical protein